MASQNSQNSKTPKKEYGGTYQNLYAIWWVLYRYATPQAPLSVSQIEARLKEVQQAPFGPGRTAPADPQAWAMGLFSDPAGEKPAGPMRLRLETAEGRLLCEDGLALEATVPPFSAPIGRTIDNLLQNILSGDLQMADTFPYQLRCVAKVSAKGQPDEFVPYEERIKALPAGARSNIPRYYYLENHLTDAEWRIFPDLILTYPFITEEQAKKFLSVLDRLHKPPENAPPATRYAFRRGSSGLFERLAVLDGAIRDHRKVSVLHGKYALVQNEETGRWEPRLTEGSRLELAPRALTWSNGNYYLVGMDPALGNLRNLRADRMLSVTPLEERFGPLPEDGPFDPIDYREHHPVMYTGNQTEVRMRCSLGLLGVLKDFFGSAARYSEPKEGMTTVELTAAPAGIKLFALQYADGVTVLSPETLRDEIRAELDRALEQYGAGEP